LRQWCRRRSSTPKRLSHRLPGESIHTEGEAYVSH
jgi:hypothetical protein